MTSQFKEWKVSGASPFYVSRNGIGVGGQWHTDKRWNAVTFKSAAMAQRRADRLNQVGA